MTPANPRRRPSPATLLLMSEGITVGDLADELGVTPQAVSWHLTGRSATTMPDLLTLIAIRGGDTLASAVRKAIDQERNLHRIRRTLAPTVKPRR